MTPADVAFLAQLYKSWGIEPILEALGELGSYAHTVYLDRVARQQLDAVVDRAGLEAVLAFYGEGC